MIGFTLIKLQEAVIGFLLSPIKVSILYIPFYDIIWQEWRCVPDDDRIYTNIPGISYIVFFNLAGMFSRLCTVVQPDQEDSPLISKLLHNLRIVPFLNL